jgi:hypothetical protein
LVEAVKNIIKSMLWIIGIALTARLGLLAMVAYLMVTAIVALGSL